MGDRNLTPSLFYPVSSPPKSKSKGDTTMYVYDVSDFFEKLSQWERGDIPLSSLERLLGTRHSQLFNFFYENQICDLRGKPVLAKDLQHTINCLLLFLALKSRKI